MPSPKISRVTPCRMLPWESPSSIKDSVAQLSTLMKPGRYGQAPSVEFHPSVRISKRAHGRDRVAVDGQISLVGFRPAAVIDHSVSNNHVVLRGSGAGTEQYQTG